MSSAKGKRGLQHVQQELFRRGGKRRGAGRKPKGTRAGERHGARPDFKPYHALHEVAPMSSWTLDWFSSAVMFPGWVEYGEEMFLWRGPETYDPLVVYQPQTWSLKEGWKKAAPISCREVPSRKR